jgi:SAM-dependent methyltransferase
LTDRSFLAAPGEVADWRMTVLFDALATAGVLAGLPATASGAARALGLDAHAVRVALDALAVWGIVARDADGRYVPGADMPGPEDAAMIRHHARAVRGWSAHLDARLRGDPEGRPAGMTEPALFLDALAVTARRSAPGVVDLCLARFPDARRVLDVGGGHGEYSLEFARRGLAVTMQDLPDMIRMVRDRGGLEEAGVDLFEGSFFEVIPDGPFDVAFCCGITHTFDGEHNLALYQRLRPVLAVGGGVAVITFLRGRRPPVDVFAVQMLVNGTGGDTHSEAEYRHWLGAAGFRVDDSPIDLPDRPQSVLFAA